ncbi:MAG: riboflavin biosynthesis protein RibF [Bacteroidales bacterium]|nr:riboflavin biosynthesis protein RibF [Bacteroidales bacterium]
MLTTQSAAQWGGEPLAISMGFFDGVHRGHQQLLNNVAQVAAERNIRSAVYTFWPHPRLVLGEDTQTLQLLNTPDEKQHHIAQHNIDYLIVSQFTEQMHSVPAREYLTQLVRQYNVQHIAVGYNHRFGYGGAGNAQLIADMSAELGYTYTVASELQHNGTGVSSTQIRNALRQGNLALANAMLGYPYHLSGRVVRGEQQGRQLGFPTANLHIDNSLKMIPLAGAYEAVAYTNWQLYPAMLHIGPCPTLDKAGARIEAHLIGLDTEIYGCQLSLSVLNRLRPTRHFDTPQALAQQLQADRREVVQRLSNVNLSPLAPINTL